MSAPETTTVPVEHPVETTPAVSEPVEAKPEETTATPAVEPTTETEAAAVAPASTEAPVTEGEAPVAEPTTETAAAAPTTEETAVATEPAKAIESGVLGYKAPGLIKSFKFSKKHFWLGDEPIATDKLSSYLRGEKPEVAHPTAAYASQTGTGLLCFVKQGEEKASPAGVLNLSEASDLEKASPHEFSFKLHGHKHTFKAANDAERDGWYVAIEKSIADAKVAKEGVVSSEGYKEALGHLSKPAIIAGGAAPAVAGARKSVDTPKIEEPRAESSSSSDEEAAAKKKEQNRSASRGKRTSLFGNLLNKKEDHETKKEIKKEEKEEAKEEKKEEQEAKAVAPTEEGEPVVAPLDAEATAARAIGSPVDEAAAGETVPPAEASKDEAARPKAAKRSSMFGTFFEKVRSPTHEKKQSEVAPIVPPKDTVVSADPPVIPEPSTETTIEAPAATEAAPAETTAAAPVVEEAAPKTAEPIPSPQRKESFFGGMMSKVRAKSPANVDRNAHKTEEAPAVPPKSADAAPTVEEPVVAAAPTETAVPTEESAVEPTKATTPKESRRKSYFGAPGNKISSIFRKPSQAVRSNKDKKENVAPATEETAATSETPATTTSEPLATETPAAAATEETKVEQPESVATEAATESREHQTAPVVSTAA